MTSTASASPAQGSTPPVARYTTTTINSAVGTPAASTLPLVKSATVGPHPETAAKTGSATAQPGFAAPEPTAQLETPASTGGATPSSPAAPVPTQAASATPVSKPATPEQTAPPAKPHSKKETRAAKKVVREAAKQATEQAAKPDAKAASQAQPAVKPRRRRHDLDLLRILAALMVVVVHANANEFLAADPHTRDWLFMDVWSALQRASVPLFFMISGAVLLSRPQLDRRRLVRHNVVKMLILFVFWSAFYAAYKVYFHQDFSAHSIALQFLRGYGHLWFLPAMAVCYLCLPPIHAALHNGRQGAIWIVGLFAGLVLLPNALELVPMDGQIWRQILAKFTPEQAGYVGYMVLGYWLNRWRYGASTLLLAPLGFMAATAASAGGTHWYCVHISKEPVEWLFGPFSPTSALQAVALFCLFLTLRNWHPRRGTAWALGELSACTLGLYLLHPFFLALLKNRGIQSLDAGRLVVERVGIDSQWVPAIGAPTLALAVALACLVISFIGRRVPVLNKVI